jgi:hypothetical protein
MPGVIHQDDVGVATLRAPSWTHRLLFEASAMLAGTLVGLAGTELALRVIDGYRLRSIRLEPSREAWRQISPGRRKASGKWEQDDDPLAYVRQLPVAAGVDREWFTTPFPERPRVPPDPDLNARARRYADLGESPNYEWNSKFASRAACRDNHNDVAEILNRLDDIYVFDPPDASESPTYRFLRNANYPGGLRTNAFGWRGSDIPLNKPPSTVRLAFVGASTTVGPHAEPYSYPEAVGAWLNQWASERHPRLVFETINAGREGINSRSIQAIVRQEIAPVQPDLVVYYEGSNQFWPADFIMTPLPVRSQTSTAQATTAAYYSATARRVESLVRRASVAGVEPPKPSIAVDWPRDLDERDPELAHPKMPVELPRILADLETIRQTLEVQGSHLAITSFEWLVYPGMTLDPQRDAFLFDYLNTKYWPYSYAHMRRFLDFQNRVFRKYAATHHLDFIDVAAGVPTRSPVVQRCDPPDARWYSTAGMDCVQ